MISGGGDQCDWASRPTLCDLIFNVTLPFFADCVQVSFEEENEKLACYFNFNIQDRKAGHGRITAEALFDLENFPSANLVITGGTEDFEGIVGKGKTEKIEGEDRDTFIYNFEYSMTKKSFW